MCIYSGYVCTYIMNGDSLLVSAVAWCHTEALPLFNLKIWTFPDVSLRNKRQCFNILRPIQNDHHFAEDIVKYFFWFHCISFQISVKIAIIYLTISYSWFKQSFGTEKASSHYLKQWWPSLLTHICITRPRWVKAVTCVTTEIIWWCTNDDHLAAAYV